MRRALVGGVGCCAGLVGAAASSPASGATPEPHWIPHSLHSAGASPGRLPRRRCRSPGRRLECSSSLTAVAGRARVVEEELTASPRRERGEAANAAPPRVRKMRMPRGPRRSGAPVQRVSTPAPARPRPCLRHHRVREDLREAHPGSLFARAERACCSRATLRLGNTGPRRGPGRRRRGRRAGRSRASSGGRGSRRWGPDGGLATIAQARPEARAAGPASVGQDQPPGGVGQPSAQEE